MLAKAGKKSGCLIEGMACPGGCVAGAGTNIPIPQAAKEVAGFKAQLQRKYLKWKQGKEWKIHDENKNKICPQPHRAYACGESADGFVCISDRQT